MTMDDVRVMDRNVTNLCLDVGQVAIEVVEAYRKRDKELFGKALKNYEVTVMSVQCARRDFADAICYEASLASFGEDEDD